MDLNISTTPLTLCGHKEMTKEITDTAAGFIVMCGVVLPLIAMIGIILMAVHYFGEPAFLKDLIDQGVAYLQERCRK